MNTDHFKKLLIAKRRDLQSHLSKLEQEGSNPAEPLPTEVGDYTDAATADQGVSDSLTIATKLSETLDEVQDALRRLEDGSYGKCTECGREIQLARLEAIPWTAYCLQDQEKLDSTIPEGATL
jgi:DnaK suppressor protein